MNTIKNEDLVSVTGGALFTNNNTVVVRGSGGTGDAYNACLDRQAKTFGPIAKIFQKDKMLAQQERICGPMLRAR